MPSWMHWRMRNMFALRRSPYHIRTSPRNEVGEYMSKTSSFVMSLSLCDTAAMTCRLRKVRSASLCMSTVDEVASFDEASKRYPCHETTR